MARYAEFFLGKTPASPEPEAVQPAAGAAPYTLLFVDDEPNVLSALRRVFRRENYRVLTAAGGAEGLALLSENEAQIVVSDFKMPQMDGAAFLRQVKERYPFTIRIMLTGYADVAAIMGAVNDGAVYKFITKPWQDDDLRLTVSLALEQHDLIKENRELKERNRSVQRQLQRMSRLTSVGQSSLAKMLHRQGVLTEGQVDKAAEVQQRTQDAMPVVLTKLEYADEAKIYAVIQRELKIDVVSLAELTLNETLLELIPESYCRKNYVLPLRQDDKKLVLAMADPTDLQKIDDLRFVSGFTVVPVLARAGDILARLDQLAGAPKDLLEPTGDLAEIDPYENIEIIDDEDEYDVRELLTAAETPPAIRVVNAIILESIRLGASDVHIEPKTEYSRVRFRVDGLLVDKIHLPSHLHAATVSRIKVMAGMDISERRVPQDGRVAIKTAQKIVDLRASSLPTINGEKIVLRLLDRNAAVLRITDLGVDEKQIARLHRIIQRPQGLFLVVGPTGSGKTTTLYAILREQATITKNFVTIEDPVEYFMEPAEQVHVRERVGLNFAGVLRSILRQDPDVIMVGEIRDLDTATVAFQAAMTGHLVLSTLHANDTVSAITRLRDIGVAAHVISGGVSGVVSQRLMRRICPECREAYRPPESVLSSLGLRDADFTFMRGKGCRHCHETGYVGRVGVFEILEVNHELKELIHSDASEYALLQAAKLSGMEMLREDGYRKIRRGETTCEELLRVLGPVTEFSCPACRQVIDENFNRCPFCGAVIRKQCPSCHQVLRAGWHNCPFCGGVVAGAID